MNAKIGDAWLLAQGITEAPRYSSPYRCPEAIWVLENLDKLHVQWHRLRPASCDPGPFREFCQQEFAEAVAMMRDKFEAPDPELDGDYDDVDDDEEQEDLFL
jgi:hypothetical protein